MDLVRSHRGKFRRGFIGCEEPFTELFVYIRMIRHYVGEIKQVDVQPTGVMIMVYNEKNHFINVRRTKTWRKKLLSRIDRKDERMWICLSSNNISNIPSSLIFRSTIQTKALDFRTRHMHPQVSDKFHMQQPADQSVQISVTHLANKT